jgi:hypothetical protein
LVEFGCEDFPLQVKLLKPFGQYFALRMTEHATHVDVGHHEVIVAHAKRACSISPSPATQILPKFTDPRIYIYIVNTKWY